MFFLYFQVIFMGREEEKYWFCCKINFPSTSKLRLVFHVFITCLMHSSSTFLAWGMSIMSSPNMWKYVWDEKRQTPAGRQRRQWSKEKKRKIRRHLLLLHSTLYLWIGANDSFPSIWSSLKENLFLKTPKKWFLKRSN